MQKEGRYKLDTYFANNVIEIQLPKNEISQKITTDEFGMKNKVQFSFRLEKKGTSTVKNDINSVA